MPEHRTDTAATPAPDDTLRERLLEAAVVVWQQRSDERITASPTEHCAAMADALLPLIRDHVATAVQAERERVAQAIVDAAAKREQEIADIAGITEVRTTGTTGGMRRAARLIRALDGEPTP